MWITNGTLTGKETGDLFLVYARTGTQKRSDITQFIVEGGIEGFSVGQKIIDKLGMRASPTAELVFEMTQFLDLMVLYESSFPIFGKSKQ
jgi:isovaleryl-CoA dehydrogenase